MAEDQSVNVYLEQHEQQIPIEDDMLTANLSGLVHHWPHYATFMYIFLAD